jgi:hypothetical protein
MGFAFDERIKKRFLSTYYFDKEMSYYLVVVLIFVISYQFTITDATTNDDESESLWSTDKGNSQNTYRIIPSMATNYSKMPWIYEYNLTSQDVTEFGQGAGINGDIYFFLSETRYHKGNYVLSLWFQ